MGNLGESLRSLWTILEGVSSLYFVLVLDFGHTLENDTRSSIDDLVDTTVELYAEDEEAVILAQSCSYAYLVRSQKIPAERLVKIEAGQSGTFTLNKGSTYDVLKIAKRMIDKRLAAAETRLRYDRIVRLVAHSLHATRAMRQGLAIDLLLIPDGPMPTRLYETAEQWWCRSEALWKLREALGIIPLKLARQI